jgi:hypothetical protein
MSEFGKLKQIKDIKSKWRTEAQHFSPWLAEPENLELLGETLGFGGDWLEHVGSEVRVGEFRADILCKDTSSENGFVIIENQFGKTDHDHLGKLLTYAAGHDAKTIIWIAERIRDEHRAAIDLLNTSTHEDFQFFALEIELWQIADSPIAPRFNVVAKPNDWVRHSVQTSRARDVNDLTDLKKQYIRYWTAFKEVLEERSDIRAQKAGPRQWIYMPIGRTNFTLTANVNSREKWVQAQFELHQDTAPAYFALLQKDQAEIDDACPFSLSWEPLPNRKGARIATRLDNADPTDEADWQRQHEWLVERLNTLREIFRERALALDLDDLDEDEPS